MFKTGESKVAVAILASFGLLLVTLVQDMYNVVGMAIALVAVILFVFFALAILRKPKEPRDERSERFSFLASRNGFIISILAVTAFCIFARAAGLSAYWIMDMLGTVWGVGVITYMLSYLYYHRTE
jgi:amino acid transporter